MIQEQMPLTGVNKNIILLSLLSSMLPAEEVVIYEINKIENITRVRNSSITQGGVTITTSTPLVKRSPNHEKNSTISQGVVIIEDENMTDVDYDILNIVTGFGH